MDGERGPVDSRRLLSLAEKFQDKQYRDTYVATHTRNVLARQMRNFRGSRHQAEYGAVIGKRQTVVSRLESPAYGSWTLRTMLDVARKENVAVIVRFVDFSTFLRYSGDLSDEALHPAPYDGAVLDNLAQQAEATEESLALKALFSAEPAKQRLGESANEAALHIMRPNPAQSASKPQPAANDSVGSRVEEMEKRLG